MLHVLMKFYLQENTLYNQELKKAEVGPNCLCNTLFSVAVRNKDSHM